MKRKNSSNSGQFSKTALAILALLGLVNQAEAQDGTSLVAADSLNGVTDVRQLADGSVELVFADGEVVKVDANDITIQNGQVFITADAVASLAESGAFAFLADNALLVGAGVIAAAGIGLGVGLSGGGDDEVEPSEGADVLVGSELGESISGLGGDDSISGLGGDDTLDGGAGDDSIDGGAGSDTLIGGLGDDILITDVLDTLDGGEGIDTADFSNLTDGVVVDLDVNTPTPGPASQDGAVLSAPGGDVLQTVTDVENIIGTQGDDVLLGNNEINVIEGGAGDDAIHSFGGVDTIDGGAGTDTALFSAGPGVIVDLDETGSGQAFVNEAGVAGGESDFFSDFENVNGSVAGDDILSGNSLENVLNGQGGNDVLDGEGGADTLIGGEGDDTFITDGIDQIDGGEGIDTVDFSNLEEGVIVDLDVETAGANQTNGGVDGPSQNGAILDAPPAAGGQPVDGINLVDVENVVGSDFNDGLFGNNESNVIEAGSGNDLVHGFAGDDTLDGGEGVDTVLFSAAPAGVDVDLEADTATGGAGNNTISNFENVTGSQSDDTILGDSNDNALNGNGGDDILTGGLGNDTLIGGEGFDTADFSDVDVPVEIVVDAQGNGSATRDTGFSVEVTDAVVDGGAFGAELTPESFVSEAVAGNIYFNIHTSEFTGGEIRGQLGVVTDATDADGARTIVLEGELDAAQEPSDASDSDATGFATLTITVAADGTVTYSSTLDVEGIAPSELISLGTVSAIHLHNAPAGVNGPVVQDFIVDAGNAGPALPFTVVDAVTETDTLASIEAFILSDDGDSFISSGGGSQTVFAGEGDDFVQAGGGSDVTDGGEGVDTVSFADIGSSVTVNLAAEADQAQYLAPNGNTVIDQVTNFENVVGSANNDSITGDENNNVLDGGAGADSDTLIGGAGDDVLIGRGGTDFIDGGEGVDTNSFEGIGFGVTANVTADGSGTAEYGAVNETFAGIENLTGTDNNDVLTATGAAANVINGGAGDDLIAGGGGTDILDGGEGNDTNSFQGIGFDVVASLEDGTASYGPVEETFVNFENLLGSDNNDSLTGDAGANVLDGALGDDTLVGGLGDDSLIGGNGNDTATFADLAADITVTENDDGTLTVETLTEGTDTLTSIETVLDGNGDVVFQATPATATSADTQSDNALLTSLDLTVEEETNVNEQLDATSADSPLQIDQLSTPIDGTAVVTFDEDVFALDAGSNTPPVPLSGSDLGDSL